ncbi:right-handed parallel beta-helix repeat-containing protein [Halovulum sp. GXIMD14794]
MPKILGKLPRLAAGAAIAATLIASGATAGPEAFGVGLRAKLRTLEQAAADPAQTHVATRELIREAGLLSALDYVPEQARPKILTFPAGLADPIHIDVLDARLALAMLAQSHGATDNGKVIAAQASADLPALVLHAGDAGLADLKLFLRLHDLQEVADSGPLVLRVPLVTMAGSSLNLLPGEALHLDREAGAFVVNMGVLRSSGAEIAGVGGENPGSAEFVPFVTSTGGGAMQILASRISDLGFGYSPKFSGLSVLRNGLMPAADGSHLRDSRISGLVSVSVAGVPEFTVIGNRFSRMSGRSVMLAASPRAIVKDNIFHSGIENNAIRVTEGSAGATVSGNVVLGGRRSGIVVEKSSHRSEVTGNIVWKRDGGGLKIDHADCGRIAGNLLIDNRQKGIEVRSGLGTKVAGNRVIANESAGIWVSAQDIDAVTFLDGNVMAANGTGLSSATPGQVYLSGNDFSNQFPRFLHGDMARHNRWIASDLKGAQPVLISNNQGGPAGRPYSRCGQ